MPYRFAFALAAMVLSASAFTAAHAGAPRVLYQASWTHTMSGWRHSSGGWTDQRGILTYNGESASVLVAPFRAPATPYAVEATVRVLGWRQTGISESHGMGVLVRARGLVDPIGDTAGIMAGIGQGFVGCDGLHTQPVIATADTDLTSLNQDSKAFLPKRAWHVYRVEVRGTTLTLLIDGHLRTKVATKQFAGASSVGIFSLSTGIQVRNFRVLQL
jgi:hypothetical protein